ncbi:MAG: tetratricopeptide repeat protein [Clostridium tyrobutyricum]|uniref:tetratricopeptide repeat protein n=1 Tax=Clostridium tyrobutyricum TaxID=1519 RepID=UPI00242F4D03|nr:tetratricopeptide repeat protein [Clostridium tyrobutyricum]MCH4199281.1 tetratricopeptide repeat protein [Clostridium tyrobutyricum]MCH4236613.1 tetratricopeptide repeat protein [Clostridium tyrobutyricum]MCH4258071.1 tetratricopeptide repeat protein [Clostridium tyrobutyricum]MCI1239110.1 tetratricopeptide repeat protein [Clostridium tyrobutyricum]MCI1651418.1 tetratricopeptide repeat protein [Clostridium tyrobutyricum]
MLKKITAIVSILLISIAFVGCAPKGDPSQVLNNYYDSIKNGDAEGAYNTLASTSQKNFKKDDFTNWINTQNEYSTLKSVKVTKNKDYKSKELDGIVYKNAAEFNVTENTHDNYENKDTPINYKRYVVNDNGQWKVYREKENGKDVLSESIIDLASMYSDGKGKEKDPNKAASILNESVKTNPNYNGTYYALASVYCNLQRYDESINAANKYLNKDKSNEDKSDTYNILGIDYKGKEDYENAKKYFNQSIQLNPNNQYAKTNLQQLTQEEQVSNIFN